MNILVLKIFYGKLGRTSPYIPFFEPIAFLNPVLRSDQHKTSYVKFAFTIQQRVRNVQLTISKYLQYKSFRMPIFMELFIRKHALNLLKI